MRNRTTLGARRAWLAMSSLAVLGFASGAQAQTWTGGVSTDWFNSGNWSPAAVPTGASDASITNSNGATPAVVNAAGAAAKGLTLGSNPGQTGALDVTGSGQVAVGGDGLIVGDFGIGNLTVENGGNITVAAGSFAVLGNNAGSSGSVTVTGAGSLFATDQLYLAADASNANFVVSNGGKLSATSFVDIADFNALASGNLTVTGSGSQLITPATQVGTTGTGVFKLLNGATASGGLLLLGVSAGATGAVQVDGAGSVLTTSSATVGSSGNGVILITNGGVVHSSSIASLASSAGGSTANASATVDGAGSKWTTGNFLLGTSGSGNVTVSNGGSIVSILTITGSDAFVGNGNFTVTGTGSSWEIGGNYTNSALAIGAAGGPGALKVLNGGNVTIDTSAFDATLADVRVGVAGNGVLTVDGAGSRLTTPYNFYVGFGGNIAGAVTVSNGGVLTTGYSVISLSADATTATADSVTVTGAGSLWTINDTVTSDPSAATGLSIGRTGFGSLTIANGGTVTVTDPSAHVVLGGLAGSSGTLNIGGNATSAATAPGTLNAKDVIFATGAGPLTINFNHTSSNYVFAPQITGSGPGAVNILAGTTIFTADNTYTGNTTISAGATLQFGNGGTTGSITGGVTDNGALILDHSTTFTYAGPITGTGNLTQAGTGTAILHGASTYSGGTTIDAGSTLQIGDIFADGSIVGPVDDEGTLTFYRTADTTFSGAISGAGSLQKLGNGNLTLTAASSYSGGTTVSAGRLLLGASNRLASTGALTVNGTGAFDLNGFDQTVGDLFATGGTLAIGTGNLTAGAAANANLTSAITGTGHFIKQGAGTWTIPGNVTFSGLTTVNAGRINVNGNMTASTFLIANGGTLGGGGAVGNTTVSSGGILAGLQGQTLSLGSLTLNPGAILNVGLGAPGTTALFAVGGDLTLDGTLNIASTGAFGPGLYRLMTYAGNLTDNGLDIGTIPAGADIANLSVQTSVANQVNLIESAGPLDFWNGSTLAPTGTIVGGTGTWKIGPTNWTDSAGATSGTWPGGFAIFEGAPGVVTVDDSGGAIDATGLQFAVDGYSVVGGALTLTGGSPTIRVGDGTAGGAAFTANITAPIAGSNGLIKTDLGTLILGGANTYTGGTDIESGTLQVSADVNLGDAAGNLTLDGGVLKYGAGFSSGRTVTIGAAGGTIDTNGQSATLSGPVSGSGALTKQGAGTLDLTGGDSGYTGPATVKAGVLQIDGAFGGSAAVQSGATLTGSGNLAGAVTVANGGILAGAAGQTLTMGSLILNPTSNIDVALGAPSTTGLFKVNGALTLDGTLNVTDAGGFGAGVYRVIDYTGALTNNGLTIGSVPAGVFAGALSIQTSVSDQVNLVFAAAGPLQFWNGTTLAPTGTIVGGAGTWKIGPTNWTDAAGDATGAWGGTFGVFEGTAGAVTIDNTGGAIDATGLQFAVSGYSVGGGTLTLTGATPTIRVGDGTPGGASDTATINAPIAGSNGLIKTDLGTLILGGANTYTGGTTITDGTLSVGADANLGDATGGVVFNGGSLAVTAGFASNRTFDVQAASGISIATGDTLNLTGDLIDTGALTKSGAGVLRLSGAGGYSGALTVAAGTLRVDGSIGAATVTVQSGATLAGAGSIGGPVSIANGGSLAGVAGQTLSMGALTLNATSNLDVALGAPGTTALFQVNGALTLDGTLNVTDAGGFGVGVYRVIDYTGALTDNGLAIGAVPAGVSAGDLSVQTSVADQVNLVFASPASGPLQFWNGSTLAPTGTIVGGAGTWKIGPTNWTDAAGATSGGWSGTFAIFEGAPGAVTIDDSAGAIDATGLQFAVDGYTVGGGTLTLTGAAPTIRVGDGTAAGAGYVATISAPIAGSNGLIKTDLGTLVLAGQNSYSGGTTISGGTLVGAADSFGSGPLLDNAALVIDQPVDASLANAITGTGRFTKRGAGALDLTGADAISGAAEVAGGALKVDGSLAASSVTVDAGASLGGSGQITGAVTVLNGGTFAPGDPVTTTVVGALTFSTGSTYLAQVTAAGAHDLIAVTGPVTIQSGATLEVDPLGVAADYARLSSYPLITATGGVTGTFASVVSDLAFLTPHVTYAPDEVDLALTRNDISFASLACTPNQAPVAAAAEAGGFGTPLYMALVVQTKAGACQGYDAISGELFADIPTILLSQSDQTRRTLTDRMQSAVGTRGVWAEAIGSWASFDGARGIAGAHTSLGGVTVGIDDTLARWRFGVAGTYQENTIDVPGRLSSADDRATGLSAYAGGGAGPLTLRLGASYAWHRIDTARNEIFPGLHDHTTAGFNAQTGQAFGEVGYDLAVQGGFIEPFAGLSYDEISTEGTAERGGPSALRVAGQTRGVLSARLGVRLSVKFGATADPDWSFNGSLAWRHASNDLGGSARLAFVGTGQAFIVGGLPVAQEAAEITAGLSAKLGGAGRIDLSYSGELAQRWQDHAVRLRGAWSF